MYRMALDQTPQTNQMLRNRLLRSSALGFVRVGQYADAAAAFDHVLEARPTREFAGGVERKVPMRDFPTAFNLALCQFALGGMLNELLV